MFQWIHAKEFGLHHTTLLELHWKLHTNWIVLILSHSYPNVPTMQCLTCNTACLTCSGAVNNAGQCASCATGYWSSSGSGPCLNCYVGCKTCNGLTATSCLSCSGTYFFLSSNTSCVTSCPSLYFASESLNQCIGCDTLCLTCNGLGTNYCTSCKPGTYLSGTTCISLCVIPQIGYVANNTCIATCPYTNYVKTSDNTCRSCPNNCGVCLNSSFCLSCINSAVMHTNLCITSCPAGMYIDTVRLVCQACHSSCLTCNSISYG